MQEIHYFLQRFLRLILSGDILEGHTGLFLYIYFRCIFANAHRAATHTFHEESEQYPQNHKREQEAHDIVDPSGSVIRDLALDIYTGLLQCRDQIIITDIAGIIGDRYDLVRTLFRCDVNLLGIKVNTLDLTIRNHLQELRI